jgi:hypothetical protein
MTAHEDVKADMGNENSGENSVLPEDKDDLNMVFMNKKLNKIQKRN